MLVVCLSFAGCDNLGKTILSALSLDITVSDPALVKVEDILDKKVKTESVKTEALSIHCIRTTPPVSPTTPETIPSSPYPPK